MGLSNKRLLAFLFLALLISGCASNGIYRNTFSDCIVTQSQDCEEHSIQLHNGNTDQEYMLGFVEFDDQGQLRKRKQMNTVMDKLLNMKMNDEGLLINVFVHGWHHSAKPQDPNVESFKHSLAQLSQIESDLAIAQGRLPRTVAGVYVGWRGESIDVPWLNNITFWNRKSTAQEVGYSGIPELLFKLVALNNMDINPINKGRKSHLVIVGHSFGAAAVFSATAQTMASRLSGTHENLDYMGDAKGFGDRTLVVLLNPAFEALRYASLFDVAQERCSYFPAQKPLLVILTSEADNATKYLFPMGRIFTTFFETHLPINRDDCRRPVSYHQWAGDISAAGHFAPLLTHELRPAGQVKKTNYSESVNVWREQQDGGVQHYGATDLTHLGKTVVRNPYLNVKVDKRLIKDHNDIFGKEIQDFLRQLIVISTQD